MAAPRSAAPQPNLAPLISWCAVIAAVGASALRLPGGVVLLIGLVAATWFTVAPPLTGKKDSAGYPTIGNPGEGRAMRLHQRWTYLRWRLVFPNRDWLLNDPQWIRQVRQRAQKLTAAIPPLKKATWTVTGLLTALWLVVPASFISITALACALVTYTMPVDAFAIWGIFVEADTTSWLMWPNAACVYIAVVQTQAARRRFAAPNDPQPAVTVGDLLSKATTGRRIWQAALYGSTPLFVGASVSAGVAWGLHAAGYAWLFAPVAVTAAGTGAAVAALVARQMSLPEALTDWRNTVESREMWSNRWEPVKVDPQPYLVSHVRFGESQGAPVTVDVFDAPASLGAAGVIALEKKLAPAIGGGMSVTILNEPDIDGQGQDVPGSKHPTRFAVVCWPADTTVDLTALDADEDLVRLRLRVAGAQASVAVGYPQLCLTDVTPIHSAGAGAEHVEADVGTAAYTVTWSAPDAPAANVVATIADAVAGIVDAETVHDPKAHAGPASLYVGALTAGTTTFTDESLPERFEILSREARWRQRWSDALKMGEAQPVIQSQVYKEVALPSGQVIECQPFMTPQGISGMDYMTRQKEEKLAPTLSNAPWVHVIGWEGSGDRPGERHPGAFRVLWSRQPIPLDPARLVPERRGRRSDAIRWALCAAVNAGFDAAKLARPEVVGAGALTTPESRGHIWDVKLRLYGGVTLQAVKAASEKIRGGMGACSWLRVSDAGDGIRLVAGTSPDVRGIEFTRPEARRVCLAMDWEQHFTDAKLASPVDGGAPRLTDAHPLETNEQVDVMTFTLPRGLALSDYQEQKAVDKLRAAAGKEFVNIRAADEPTEFTLLACDIDPMPNPAPFHWDSTGEEAGERQLAFATDVEGAPVDWEIDLDSHLMVLGSNGSGKLQPLDTRIPVPVSSRFPTGFATVGELQIGDRVFDAHGRTDTIESFSETRTEPVYVFTLDDGQEVRSGPRHLWKVMDARARAKSCPQAAAQRLRWNTELLAEADRFESLARSIGTGQGASLARIAAIAGISTTRLHGEYAIPRALARQGLIQTSKRVRVYAGADIAGYMRRRAHVDGAFTFDDRSYSLQDIDDLGIERLPLSVRSIADALVGDASTRRQRGLASQFVRREQFPSMPGFERTLVDLYPVDEVLHLLAERNRSRVVHGWTSLEHRILHSDEIADEVRTGSQRIANFSIDVPLPFAGEETEIPVPAYTLGAWLGDGSTGAGTITGIDPEIFDEVSRDGYAVTAHKDGSQHGILGLRPHLTKAGVFDDKRIPRLYQRAAFDTRLALLQGLMDTDGTVSESGSCELSLNKRDLAMDALELIRSLGIKASMSTADSAYQHGDERRVTGTRHRITFVTTLPAFRLPRKRERLPSQISERARRLFITDVRVEDAVPQRCLRLHGASHMYLTDHFVPTHNSVALTAILTDALLTGWDVYAADPIKGFNDFVYADPWLKIRATDYPTTVATVRRIVSLLDERKQLNAEHGVSNIKDLPDEVRPPVACMILDEFTSLVIPETLPKLTDQSSEQEYREHAETTAINSAKATIGSAIGRILREGRATGIVMILSGQKFTSAEAKHVPGGATIKSQVSRLAMGKMSFGDMMSAFNDAAAAQGLLGPAVPRGRGIFESTAQAAFAVQTWWGGGSSADHFDAMTRRLEAVRGRLTSNDRFDPSPFLPSDGGATGQVFGAIVDGEEGEDADDQAVVDVDLGLSGEDFDFEFDDPGEQPPLDVEPESALTPDASEAASTERVAGADDAVVIPTGTLAADLFGGPDNRASPTTGNAHAGESSTPIVPDLFDDDPPDPAGAAPAITSTDDLFD